MLRSGFMTLRIATRAVVPLKPQPVSSIEITQKVARLYADELSTGKGRALRLAKLGGSTLGAAIHDFGVAQRLPATLNTALLGVKPGKPLSPEEAPRPGVGGRYVAPNGDPLIRGKLNDGNGVVGSADYGLVDPLTNQFYKEENHGGFAHPTEYTGPYPLPKGERFEGPKLSAGELAQLEKVANRPPPPNRAAAALEAHLKAGDLTFTGAGPDPKRIASSKVIKQEHPFTYTAITLAGDPNHVIIKKVLTGGFVPARPGDGTYSQPIAI
jgi:hypothetical protein